MNRSIVTLAIVLLAVAAGYLAFYYIPQHSVIEEGTASTTPVAVATHTLEENAAEYSIDIEYAQFGIPVFDAIIQKAMDDAVAALKEQAAGDQPVSSGFRKYELSGRVVGTYLDEEIASAHLVLAQDFGGAHPLPIVMTFNFDRIKNAEVTQGDALRMIGRSLAEVAMESKAELSAQLGEDVIAPEGADAKAENYQTFIVGKNTVRFIFQPYQVAPYSAGSPEVSFPRI